MNHFAYQGKHIQLEGSELSAKVQKFKCVPSEGLLPNMIFDERCLNI